MSFGVFKELHGGQGIYWAGTFNIEGGGSFRTIQEARAKIDSENRDYEAREIAKKRADAAAGKCFLAERVGEGAVFHLPTGDVSFPTMHQARQKIDEYEEQLDLPIAWI